MVPITLRPPLGVMKRSREEGKGPRDMARASISPEWDSRWISAQKVLFGNLFLWMGEEKNVVGELGGTGRKKSGKTLVKGEDEKKPSRGVGGKAEGAASAWTAVEPNGFLLAWKLKERDDSSLDGESVWYEV
ncbi:hypothetical protein MMC10_007161 [Thelotrema lepadinum]|nr:hypothetical protein [Thelotrema lepadinum]